MPASRAGGRVLVSPGTPLPEHELEILGPDGRALDEREVGEITLRSPCLMSGYDHAADASAEALREGRYHTGDLGYLAGGGFRPGRARDLIIVGGRNIYPQDVETVVEGVEGVSPPGGGGSRPRPPVGDRKPGVFAETRATDPATRERLRQEIHAAVAERTEVVPHVVRVLDHRSLLKSSSGKPARRANRERLLPDTAADAAQPPIADPPAGDRAATVRRVVEEVLANVGDEGGAPDESTPLLTSGRIDSFGLVELFAALEDVSGLTLGAELRGETERFDTISAIAQTLAAIGGATAAPGGTSRAPVTRLDPDAIPMRWRQGDRAPRARRLDPVLPGPLPGARDPLWTGTERPGADPAPDRRDPANIQLGTNVTLMLGAHLKNRERGRIVLHDGVKLDTMARLVAANDARIELGERVAIGMGTVVNAGRDVLLGRGCLTAAHCVIDASDHGIAAGAPIQSQPFDHAPIDIDEDVWLGAGVGVSRGSRIGAGVVVSAGSTVSGAVPPGAIVHGSPARPVKYRR